MISISVLFASFIVSLGNLCDFHLCSIRLLHCLSWHDLTRPCGEQARLADTEREKAVLREELDTFRDNFQAQQTSWLDEKEKVIRYEWMDGKRGGRTDRWTSGRTDGWIDGWTHKEHLHCHSVYPLGTLHPLSRKRVCPPTPADAKGGDTHSPACEGGGLSIRTTGEKA